MTERKTSKTRIPEYDKKRFQKELGDTNENDYLAGAIYDLLDGHVDEEYLEKVAELRELQGETAEIDGRIDRIDDRIEELQAKREELAEERDEKQEHIKQLKETLADASAGTDDGGERSTVEDVAYELLVGVAHDEFGTNSVTAGLKPIQEAALRAEADPDDVIEEMRRLAEPATETKYLEVTEDPLERGFLLTDDDRRQDRLSETAFDDVRRGVAEAVLDEEDVDWDEVPEQDLPDGFK